MLDSRMLRHASSERFVRLRDLLRNIVIQDEQDRKLLDRAPVNEEYWRKTELFGLLVQHFVELASRIALTGSFLNPWPVASHRIRWLRLWEVGVLLKIERLGFSLSQVVG